MFLLIKPASLFLLSLMEKLCFHVALLTIYLVSFLKIQQLIALVYLIDCYNHLLCIQMPLLAELMVKLCR